MSILGFINKMNGVLPFDNYKLLIGTVLMVAGYYMNPDVAAATQIMEFVNSISGADVFNVGAGVTTIGGVGKIPKLK